MRDSELDGSNALKKTCQWFQQRECFTLCWKIWTTKKMNSFGTRLKNNHKAKLFFFNSQSCFEAQNLLFIPKFSVCSAKWEKYFSRLCKGNSAVSTSSVLGKPNVCKFNSPPPPSPITPSLLCVLWVGTSFSVAVGGRKVRVLKFWYFGRFDSNSHTFEVCLCQQFIVCVPRSKTE